MNKTLIHFLFSLTVVSASCGAAFFALAHEEGVADTQVRLLPNNKLYFLKEWSRGAKLFFTFNPIKKEELRLKHLHDKDDELRVMKEKDVSSEALEKALANYEKARKKLLSKFEALKENPNVENLMQKFNEQIKKHKTLFQEKIEEVVMKKEAAMEATIEVNEEGSFVPQKTTIKKGGKVTWINKDSKFTWPASAMHPTHSVYPGFDALRPLKINESYSFTFDEIGSWKYHDHLNPSQTGTIEVVE